MTSWIVSSYRVALDIGVPRKAKDVIAVAREDAVRARKLAGHRVVVAGVVVVNAGGAVAVLAGETVIRGHGAVAVARATVWRVEQAGRSAAAGVEGHQRTAKTIGGEIGDDAVHRQRDPLAVRVVVGGGGRRAAARDHLLDVADIDRGR